MASAKKKRRLGRVAAVLLQIVQTSYRRRAVIAALVVFAGFWYGGWRLWNRLENDVLARPEYRLAPHQIQITRPPPWIHGDIKAEALRDGSLDGMLSITDDELAKRLAKAFGLHPWVAHVDRVTAHYPARVMVELAYRQPAAMVEVPGGLFPVDEQGVLLPSADFSPEDARQYPRLTGIESQPLGPVGTTWQDRGVSDGVKIAVALGSVWNDLGLYSIRRVSTAATMMSSPDVHYELTTKHGTMIPWGRAPGNETSSEARLAEKLERLKKYVADHGDLDQSARRNDLDLRVREATRTAARGGGPD